MFSAQAHSISINGIDGVAGSKWVDFGLAAFGLSVRSPEDEEGEAPELVPFPYGGLLGAGRRQRQGRSCVYLALSCLEWLPADSDRSCYQRLLQT